MRAMNDALIQTVTVYALPLLFAITLHEAAHGYVARRFGDNTAYVLGRVTLNPLKHVDPFGTVVMPLLLYFVSGGAVVFGYAKPVPVSFRDLRNPRWDGLWVSLAGPGCNFAQALLWQLASLLLHLGGVTEPFLLRMAHAGVLVNLVICVFNLFPLPPLDGGRVLTALLPRRAAASLARVEPYGFVIVMALIFTGLLTNFWLLPLMRALYALIALIFFPVAALLH